MTERAPRRPLRRAAASTTMTPTLTLAFVTWISIAGSIPAAGQSTTRLPEADPAALGFDPGALARIDAVLEKGIADKMFPGAVALVARDGRIARVSVVGDRAVLPTREAMTRDTIFDMASLTKPIAAATSVMLLIQDGRIALDDPIVKHLPELGSKGKDAITVEHLLRHRAGLIADNALADYRDGEETAWKRICDLGLLHPPGERFLYTDVGYVILGELVRRVSGQPLDEFARERIFEPLRMADTGFRRLSRAGARADDAATRRRIAPTALEDGEVLRGVVHDPRARLLDGVAGHAGLFSTADDVALYAQTLLSEGVGPTGEALLKPEILAAMVSPGDTPEGQRRGLGWDVRTGYSAPRGRIMGASSYGHTGFTGTSLWIDPERRMFVILLTSRLHPDGRANLNPIRAEIATIAAEALVRPDATPTPTPNPRGEGAGAAVLPGIDVLERGGFAPLKGKRVGLITNHTGKSLDGRATIDILHDAPEVRLSILFSPEHGIRGLLDANVPDSTDERTGLPIRSLYGRTRKPTAEDLENLDALVFDIQDIGARFYTYISTLGLAMEAAAERGIPIVVLDRPNPIGGLAVSGPVRDPGFESFIAFHATPVRHGMTVGEIARMFNVERGIGADLEVVACEGWRRGQTYDQTNLLWVNPSPNMRSLTEALLYPGVGLLEATNLATGRGTDTPFERVGAPWIDPRAWAAAINALGLPGVRAVPIRFTPSERQYAGKECGGVYLAVTDWSRFEPVDLGLGLATTLRALYPNDWNPDGFLKMIADRATHEAVLAGKSVEEIRALHRDELEEFLKVRAKYLLPYPE